MAGITSVVKIGRAKEVPLFDGRTLDGWQQIENNATSLAGSSIRNPAAFVERVAGGSDAMSVFLRGRLDDAVKQQLAGYRPGADTKAVLSALVKNLNQILAGPVMPVGPRELRSGDPRGWQTARVNKLLLEDAYPGDIEKSAATGWTVKDGAMASTGSGRGVIYTKGDYTRFRLRFTMRHVSGNPDHQACVLIFCTRPGAGEKPLDALGGIQFQVPNGGHWDYRPGMNNAGGAEFTKINQTHFDVHEWSRVEIEADATTGTARMTVAQPVSAQAVEVLAFRDPAAGKAGPVAWQMHNAGLFDEYKEVSIEAGPG